MIPCDKLDIGADLLPLAPLLLLHNHQKDKIAYVHLNPVSDYVYIADLIPESVLAEKRYPTKLLN